MKRKHYYHFLVLFLSIVLNSFCLENKDEIEMQSKTETPFVYPYTLDNGLTIIVRPVKTIPKVCIEIWYNVGSKDEKSGEKGIAHLIEHMIFKGTEKMSESDINVAIHKLSGTCNAFTSYDYTGYLFEMPTHHWKKVLPIIADCMTNASFKDEHLNSEMKAVIQELKMINDRHTQCLAYKMISEMFTGHPYQYPLIGYKKDLWSVRGKDLKDFYKKHYIPNNATLVVVGDVDPDEVLQQAKEHFESIKPNKDYKQEEFSFQEDINSKSLTLYRDIKLPEVLLSFRVPGLREKYDYVLTILSLILANGKSSRLYKKLVEEEQLVTSMSAFDWGMFDHGLFFIHLEPKDLDDLDKIEAIIFDELHDIATNGISEKELDRAQKIVQMDYYSKMENIRKQATDIGKYFLATGDKDYAFTYLDEKPEIIEDKIKNIVGNYLRKTTCCRGMIAPLPEEEKEHWKKIQEQSDTLDNKILSDRIRTTGIEAPRYAHTVKIENPGVFDFPKATQENLSNGMKVLYYNNQNTPKVDLILSLKAKGFYDDPEKPGLYTIVMRMLNEGTKNYTSQELSDLLEERGISFYAVPGAIMMSMLSEDLEFGLSLLQDMLTNATFEKKALNKVKDQLKASIKEFWDNPMAFSRQLVNEQIYKNHPYSKNLLGTEESVHAIQQKDCVSFYKKYISPFDAKISVVGDLSNVDLINTLEKNLGTWSGNTVEDMAFPDLAPIEQKTIKHPINRDQVVLCFAGHSVTRTDKDYDKLWLFDQIFGGGELHSMNSKLISLREESGLFYTIAGSLVAGANEQPGKVVIKTLVSLDRLDEAVQVITKTIDTATDAIDENQFEEAKRAISNSLVNHFESNHNIANAFLFVDKYNLPATYFDTKAEELMHITKNEMKTAAKKLLDSKKMITLEIGRV